MSQKHTSINTIYMKEREKLNGIFDDLVNQSHKAKHEDSFKNLINDNMRPKAEQLVNPVQSQYI